jgi:hypothetical protein
MGTGADDGIGNATKNWQEIELLSQCGPILRRDISDVRKRPPLGAVLLQSGNDNDVLDRIDLEFERDGVRFGIGIFLKRIVPPFSLFPYQAHQTSR